ncbi:colicin transporter [Roseobacteraceae bacterium NS-SX3]
MKQIEDLQGRILAAMDRIGAGVSALEASQAAAPDAGLAEALEEERLANAQLEERLKVLRTRLEEAEKAAQGGGAGSEDVAAMQAELELLRNEVGDPAEKEVLKAEVARLKAELESAGNSAASEKEALEEQLAELRAQGEQLQAAEPALQDTGAAADQAAEIAALRAELEEARAAAAQPAGADAAAELQRQNDMLVRLDSELQQLRLANEQLRASNAALREANAEGVGDATLINAAMEAEIEGLRAAQASDQAQVNAVLAKLEPLLANARNLPEGEEV